MPVPPHPNCTAAGAALPNEKDQQMNIKGLDYNTQREKLVLPEYGREVQDMVDHAVAIADRAERQRCANAIVAIMERMRPAGNDVAAHRRKLWDHLALMSGFRLDIDYPFDIAGAKKMLARPEPMPYPMTRIPVRHYGHMMFEVFARLKTMPAGRERDELARLAANQMKRDLYQWGHGSSDDSKVVADLAEYTDGKVQLDTNKCHILRPDAKEPERKRRRK